MYVVQAKLSWTEAGLQDLSNEMSQYRKIVLDTFSEHCKTGVFSPKFPLLKIISEYTCGIGTLPALDIFRFKQYKVHIKKPCLRTSDTQTQNKIDRSGAAVMHGRWHFWLELKKGIQ